MAKATKIRKSIDCSKCPKCATTDFCSNGNRKQDGVSIHRYKCINGHYFQESYSFKPYNIINEFRPPCPFKTQDDENTHMIHLKKPSKNLYFCKICKKGFKYKNNNEYIEDPDNIFNVLGNIDQDNNVDNDLELTTNEVNSPTLINPYYNILPSEFSINGVVNSIAEMPNNFVSQNNDSENTNFITALDFNSPNCFKVINIRDNQILYIEYLQNQNIKNNYLSLKVHHSSLGTYECEFQQMPSDIFPFLTDDQILYLIGYYVNINKDYIDQIH